MKKDISDLQDWFKAEAPMTIDYWLVMIDKNEDSDIQALFNPIPLKYTSLVFPFYYSNSGEFRVETSPYAFHKGYFI